MQHDQKKVCESLTAEQIAERRAAADAFRDILQDAMAMRHEWTENEENSNSNNNNNASSSQAGGGAAAAAAAGVDSSASSTTGASNDQQQQEQEQEQNQDPEERLAAIQQKLTTIGALLMKNPDCYSIFAFRREMFMKIGNEVLPAVLMKKAKAAEAAEAKRVQQEEEAKQQQNEQQQAGNENQQQNEQQQAGNENQQQNEQQQQAGNESQQQPSETTPPPPPPPQLTPAEQCHLYFSKEILVPEIKFNTDIVKRDYKSYAAWVHRRWILNAMHVKVRIAVLQQEHAKLEQLLAQDERNFHAWGYRRWVVGELAKAGLYDDSQELRFAVSKIGNNFSNYSAWHNRALVLWKRIDQFLVAAAAAGGGGGATTENENENSETSSSSVAIELQQQICTQIAEDQRMLVQAVYCDPHDQSAFVYCKNVVEKVHTAVSAISSSATSSTATLTEYETVLSPLVDANNNLQQALFDACTELAEEERECPWPRSMLLQLPLKRPTEKAELVRRWAELQELDPMRRNYYASEIAKL